jgi:hypothetical protein
VPPASGISDPELVNGEPPDYYRKMDTRLIILETRFDTILPALATKTDLVQLKAELKQEFRDGLGELNARVITFHGDMRSKLRELKAEMHKWMMEP